MTKQHVLALAAAGVVMLGATAASAQSGHRAMNDYGAEAQNGLRSDFRAHNDAQVRTRGHLRTSRSHRAHRAYSDAGPFSVPGAVAGAAVAGAYAAGSWIGAPASGFAGGPYGAYAYSPYYNPYADAARAQHYETPIGYDSIYSYPNGLSMGPQ